MYFSRFFHLMCVYMQIRITAAYVRIPPKIQPLRDKKKTLFRAPNHLVEEVKRDPGAREDAEDMHGLELREGSDTDRQHVRECRDSDTERSVGVRQSHAFVDRLSVTRLTPCSHHHECGVDTDTYKTTPMRLLYLR